jgi:hypothetical protein
MILEPDTFNVLVNDTAPLIIVFPDTFNELFSVNAPATAKALILVVPDTYNDDNILVAFTIVGPVTVNDELIIVGPEILTELFIDVIPTVTRVEFNTVADDTNNPDNNDTELLNIDEPETVNEPCTLVLPDTFNVLLSDVAPNVVKVLTIEGPETVNPDKNDAFPVVKKVELKLAGPETFNEDTIVTIVSITELLIVLIDPNTFKFPRILNDDPIVILSLVITDELNIVAPDTVRPVTKVVAPDTNKLDINDVEPLIIAVPDNDNEDNDNVPETFNELLIDTVLFNTVLPEINTDDNNVDCPLIIVEPDTFNELLLDTAPVVTNEDCNTTAPETVKVELTTEEPEIFNEFNIVV